jgi:hypothetical protein
MAENAAQIKELLPVDATPTAILRGDYGEERQRDFLLGAFTRLDLLIDSPLDFGLTPQHELKPGEVFDRKSFYSS